jgi:hypothetical protein
MARRTYKPYRGWSVDRVPGSGYWRATNYSDGFSAVLADSRDGMRDMVRRAMGITTD